MKENIYVYNNLGTGLGDNIVLPTFDAYVRKLVGKGKNIVYFMTHGTDTIDALDYYVNGKRVKIIYEDLIKANSNEPRTKFLEQNKNQLFSVDINYYQHHYRFGVKTIPRNYIDVKIKDESKIQDNIKDIVKNTPNFAVMHYNSYIAVHNYASYGKYIPNHVWNFILDKSRILSIFDVVINITPVMYHALHNGFVVKSNIGVDNYKNVINVDTDFINIVYLIKNCKLFIGTSSGFSALSNAIGKPTIVSWANFHTIAEYNNRHDMRIHRDFYNYIDMTKLPCIFYPNSDNEVVIVDNIEDYLVHLGYSRNLPQNITKVKNPSEIIENSTTTTA